MVVSNKTLWCTQNCLISRPNAVPVNPRPNKTCRGHVVVPHASGNNNNSNGASPSGRESDSEFWKTRGFPQYLHENLDDFCQDYEDALQSAARKAVENNGALSAAAAQKQNNSGTVWKAVRREAQTDAAEEPLLSSFLYASILSHDTFERSLAFVLSNRLSDTTLLPTELFEVFYTTLKSCPDVAAASLADLYATRERDPACRGYSQALLYYKGFHAIQCQRIAHELWRSGRHVMALMLQSRMSEVFAVDIHPAATIGRGVLLDHGTGVVIGETAEIGNNVSIMQNVTLGGTGKVDGDRHPKISDNVLIGASATILGGIRIGKGAQVAAGSLVLKPVPPKTMVAGTPAKEVGTVSGGNPAATMNQWSPECEAALQAQLQNDPFAVPQSKGRTTQMEHVLNNNNNNNNNNNRSSPTDGGREPSTATTSSRPIVSNPGAKDSGRKSDNEGAAPEYII